MSKRGESFAPADTGIPPTMDVAFTNNNPAQSIPTSGGYFSLNQPDYSQRNPNHGESDGATSFNPWMPHGQALPKKPKPGPISRSELSSSSNASKFRVENTSSVQKATSGTRLRREVFKKPHTLAHLPQGLDMVTIGRRALAPGPLTSGDTIFGVSNEREIHIHDRDSTKSPSPSPFLKSGVQALSNRIRTPEGINPAQRRRSSVHGKLGLPPRSVSQIFIEKTGIQDVQPGGSLSRTTLFSPIASDHTQSEPRDHAPPRRSVIPTTPSSERSIREGSSNIYDLRRKCELYEVAQKFDRDLIASQSQTIEELSNKNAQMEEINRDLESKHAAGVKKITQRADATVTKLTELHESFSETSATQINELKQRLDNFRQEIRDSMNGEPESSPVEPLLVGYDNMKNTLQEIVEEHEQQILEHNDEKTRLRQTNDLLRDQLSDRTGNYTESLEREKELQTSLITLGESHAKLAEALSTLHGQYDQVTEKYADSKLAENTATKRAGELEEAVTDLKMDNARVKSLLADNEQAFSRKLQTLERDNNSMCTSLETTRRELDTSRNQEHAAQSQIKALFQDKEDLLQSNSMLGRDLSLKAQSLDEVQSRNQALERQLDGEKRNLEEARAEGDLAKGQLMEKDRAMSVQIGELKTVLESHRERESSLTNEVAALNALVSALRERVKELDDTAVEHRVIEKTLLEKRMEVERIEIENSQLQSQVVQLELTRGAINEEMKQLHETSCVAREREAATQKELHELQQILKEQRQASEKACITIARMEVEIDQMKAALDKEIDAHRATEKQRDASLLSLNRLQTEQKILLDKAEAAEKTLRLSINESQEHTKRSELEYLERGNELKRLRDELNASNSAKATLEALVSEFRDSIQQTQSQHEKIGEQESKITALNSQVSGQKIELRLLEQQLSNADVRLVEIRADADAHKAAAESARSSTAAIEAQLKRKEQDLEAIRAELQSRQLSQIDAVASTGNTSLLKNKITEQEDTIKGLKSQVLELEKNSETIVERYKGGKLTNPEKDLVGVITAGIVQEKNRTINNLRGETKRADLKAQLESNGGKDPAGWNSFNNKRMTIPSSPLSDLVWHAPDHDPPAPDSPAVPLVERPVRSTRGQDQPRQYNQDHSTRPKLQHLGTLGSGPLESANAADDIQEFEDPETRVTGTTGRKRGAVAVELVDDGDEEEGNERETKRKARVKAKKDNKATGESGASNGQSNKADGPSTSTKGKTTKRRKV